MCVMYPEVRDHSVFGPGIKETVGTHLTFSARVTELGWSYGGDLSPCSTHVAWSSSIRLVYWQSGGWRWRVRRGERKKRLGVVTGMSVSPKQGKRMTVEKKDYSGYFLSVEGYICDVPLHCYICRPVCSQAQKIIVFCPLSFFVFLLFSSLARPHSCFLYYFISVSESLSPPPPLSHSHSFCLPSFSYSLLPSLSLPPTSHLCMCHFQL